MDVDDTLVRASVSRGLDELVRRGLSVAQIAREIGVHRSTVGHWRDESTAISQASRRVLAEHWPDLFGPLALAHAWYSSLDGAEQAVGTLGADVLVGTASIYDATTTSILTEPAEGGSRTIWHAGLHLDLRGGDAAADDPFFEEPSRRGNEAFRDAFAQRAAQGWRIRSVVSAGNAERLGLFHTMAERMDGPDVELRAYATAVPLTITPLVVADRDVFLAFDDRRFEKPNHALRLRGPNIVGWATTFFADLFDAAPYKLRTRHGPDEAEFARLESDLRRTADATPEGA